MKTGTPRFWAGVASVLLLASLVACTADRQESGAQADVDVNALIGEAQALLGESDFAGAAERLEQALEVDPEQARAWQLLAAARRNGGELDAAKEAYLRSYEFASNRGGAVTGLILVHAALEDHDEAYAWFEKARETPGVDLGSLALRQELEVFRGDERFAELFPPPEIFEQSPFVEDVTVLHEWRGAQGEAFGWEARTVGDVDGDGVQDAVVSAPANSPPGDNKGRVDVYSGKSGELLWRAIGEDGSQLGISIEAAGDVNKDGVPDVVAGATGTGTVYVYSGNDGNVLHTLEAPEGSGNFGNKTSTAGDVNDDGYSDVLVGAPGDGSNAEDPGKAYVYSGVDGELLLELEGARAGDGFGTSVAGGGQGDRFWLVVGAPNAGPEQGGQVSVYTSLEATPAFVIEAEDSGQQLGGMFLSLVGDVDADGVLDVYASDWQDANLGPATGRIYVHSGKTGERLFDATGEAAGDGFGIGPARAGDFNGDGADDLVVGAWQEGSAAFSGGKVYLLSGRDGSVLGTITCKVPGDTFGFDADGLGDTNGDGIPDLLLTSAWSMVAGPRSGRTFVVSGAGLVN